MPSVTCPDCKTASPLLPDNYRGTVQCSKCALIIRAIVENGIPVSATLRKIALDAPQEIPEDLRRLLEEAIICLENDCRPASLVMARVFAEGILARAGFEGRLIDAIDAALKNKAITDLGYHLANATRLLGNFGAHYAETVVNLNTEECTLVIGLVRNLAMSLISSGLLSKG